MNHSDHRNSHLPYLVQYDRKAMVKVRRLGDMDKHSPSETEEETQIYQRERCRPDLQKN